MKLNRLTTIAIVVSVLGTGPAVAADNAGGAGIALPVPPAGKGRLCSFGRAAWGSPWAAP